MSNTTDRRRKRRTVTPIAAAVLATAGTAALVAGAGITTASAATASSGTTVIEAFRETVKPWDSISIPSLSCPNGWLVDENLSPNRYVPKGVQVLEPGGVGVTITDVNHVDVNVDGVDGTPIQYRPITGTTNERGASTATNWDPFSSHELVISLHCTTNIYQASQSAR